MLSINSNFESGNIIVNSIQENRAYLEIKKDPYIQDKKQNKYQYWFYFKAKNVLNEKHTFIIQNLQIIPNPWDKNNDWYGLNICYSYDNKTWKRCKTVFTGSEIHWTIKPTKNIIWFAYYPPYTFSRTKKLFGNDKIIGYSHQKNPIYMKTIGKGPITVWVIARQHPGETIGSWMMEGFLKRVKQLGKKLSKHYTIKMIGNANPDGTILGHWYTNAKGLNLNRDWTNTESKEIKCIKKEFERKNKCDLFFDLHGDEGSFEHFLVASYANKNILHNTINKYLNEKNENFREDNFYPEYYMRNAQGSADDFSKGITVEGAMKHKINGNTIQNEPLEIGKNLADILNILQKK